MKEKLKDIFIDPLFYGIVLDYFLTLIIVYYGFGYEINPVVLTIGFTPAFVCSFLIYLFFIPKKSIDKLNYIRLILISYYGFLNIRHLIIIFSGNI